MHVILSITAIRHIAPPHRERGIHPAKIHQEQGWRLLLAGWVRGTTLAAGSTAQWHLYRSDILIILYVLWQKKRAGERASTGTFFITRAHLCSSRSTLAGSVLVYP
jgi:hypothetical protein